MRLTSLTIRTLFIIGFVIALPVIAVPDVARRLDELLYGKNHQPVPQMPQEESEEKSSNSAVADAAPVGYEKGLSDDADAPVVFPGARGGFAAEPPPPEFGAIPRVGDAAAASTDNSATYPQSPEIGPLDEQATKRLGEIRQRLEDLGAEYVLLEMTADASEYHCYCRMLAAEGETQTQSFEVNRADPLEAAEAVLARVAAWREQQQR